MPYPQLPGSRKTPQDDDQELTDLARARAAAQAAQRKTSGAIDPNAVGQFSSVGGNVGGIKPPPTSNPAAAIGQARTDDPPPPPPAPSAGGKNRRGDSGASFDSATPVVDDDQKGAPAPGADPEFDEFATERQAAKDQLEADKARQLQNQAARNGFSGLGLFGGAETALQDTARVADRNEVNSLADLDQKQRDEKLLRIKEKILNDELEADEDIDHDGDGTVAGHKVGGKYGDGDPTNDETPAERKKREKAAADGGFAHGGTEHGEIAGFHPGTNDFQVEPSVASAARESPNIPLVGTYLGSDAKWNYFRDADGSIVKVRR